jgi:thiol-disulfide isomerase/thioredoxin
MNRQFSRGFLALVAGGVCTLGVGSALAKPPTAKEALDLSPVQKDVEFDRPATDAELAKCTIRSESVAKLRGFVVYDENSQVLRRFLDTDGDNSIDQWCYFRDGIEVYRDIDSDSNGKADQYRWLGTGGTRWGMDKDEDTKIDSWKQISAEEVTEEVIAALRTKDLARFKRVLLTTDELNSLALPADRTTELERLIGDAVKDFADIAKKQKTIVSGTKWISFGGGKPGVVPASTSGESDVIVYDNVAAVVESDGKHAQVAIGTLVHVGDSWRVLDVPRSLDDPNAAPLNGVFFQGPLAKGGEANAEGGGNISPALQKLVTELNKIDTDLGAAKDTGKIKKLTASKADLLEEIVAVAGGDDKETWLRQYVEIIDQAMHTDALPDGRERLRKVINKVAGNDVQCYAEFRLLQMDYQYQLKGAKNDDIPKISEGWMDGLEQLVDKYGKNPYAAEPMLSLAQEYEIHGKEADAIKWYNKVSSDFKSSDFAIKAIGGKRRLESIGNRWMISGPSIDGKGNLTAAQLAGKVVIVQYWATWADQSKEDFDTLKKLQAKYGKQGLQVVGVNLDTEKTDAQKIIKSASLPWPNLYEPGGMDSRFANEMGLYTLPVMILIDKQGKVVSRNITADELDGELKKLLK